MNPLTEQRCFNHRAREAAARCPECGRFFCRECVTEHNDRVVCASCLRKAVASRGRHRSYAYGFRLAGAVMAGFLTVWLIFFITGKILSLIPSSFHEGTFWATDNESEAP